MKILNKLFCSHNYQLINQFEVKSEFDIFSGGDVVVGEW